MKVFIEKLYELACLYKKKPFKIIPENLNITIKNFQMNVMKNGSKRKQTNSNNLEETLEINATDQTKTSEITIELSEEEDNSKIIRKDPVLYLKLYKCLLQQMDKMNLTIVFPREALKFFITTHKTYINIMDFQDSSKKTINDKCKKNTKQTNTVNGNILIEYCKSINNFKSQINKCNASDADALRFIGSNDIHFFAQLYKPSIILLKDKFLTTKNDKVIENYHKVSMLNHKHYCICINCNVLLVWDNNQFVVPSMAFEREINLSMFSDVCNKSDLWIFDCLVPIQKIRSFTDVKIVDVIQTDSANVSIMDLPYGERLKSINRIFKKFSIPTIEKDSFNDSHIQIPNRISLDQNYNRYFYTKPGNVLAIIGICRNELLLAFKRDDGDLEFKLKHQLVVPISIQLSHLKRHPIQSLSKPYTIKDLDNNLLKISRVRLKQIHTIEEIN